MLHTIRCASITLNTSFSACDLCTSNCMHKSQALNEVFKVIDAEGYKVLSMRNKVNRLEELFFKMTHKPSETVA